MLARIDGLIISLMVLAVIVAVYGLGWFQAVLECASSTSAHAVAAHAQV